MPPYAIYIKYYIPSKKTGKNRRRRIQIIIFIIFFPGRIRKLQMY